MFKIGEFARIAQLSIHQLRHYDEIGLFRPVHIDAESGYRYYSVEQLPRLNRIVALKTLGLTLEQVRQLVDNQIDACELRGMLTLRKAQVEQIIATETTRLHQIETRLKHIERENAPPEYSVVIKQVPQQHYLSTRKLTASDAELVKITREIHHLLQKNGQKPNFHISVVHDVPSEEGLHNVEIGYALSNTRFDALRLSNGQLVSLRDLPAVETMATVVYQGARADIGKGYDAIWAWMETNAYHVAPDLEIREVYLQPGQSDTDSNNITELQIPIFKQDAPT